MDNNTILDLFFERVSTQLAPNWLSDQVSADRRESLIRLFESSEFFRDLFANDSHWALSELDWPSQPVETVTALFQGAVHDCLALPEDQFLAQIRRLRRRCMLHIVWSSFVDTDGLDRTLVAMTALADAVIQLSLTYSAEKLTARFGRPISALTGCEQTLLVIAMGKLGGGELNLSSDIDIMFAYNDPGETAGGRKSLSNQEYFTRQAQAVIRYLDAVTVDGRVFRVDTRLRPFGDSGALVASLSALEAYYQEHGRNWERYALLKARLISLDAEQHAEASELFRKFVYRRYIDFGVIDGLRDMKRLIENERISKDLDDDVKRGRGGIREAEFIVHSHQLTRGGRDPELRTRGFRESMLAVTSAGHIDAADSTALIEAYRSLRRRACPQHSPIDKRIAYRPVEDRVSVARLLNQPSWDAVTDLVTSARSQIADRFDALLAEQTSVAICSKRSRSDDPGSPSIGGA